MKCSGKCTTVSFLFSCVAYHVLESFLTIFTVSTLITRLTDLFFLYECTLSRGKQFHQRKEQCPSAVAVLGYFSGKQKTFLIILAGEGIKSVSFLQEGKLIGNKTEQTGAITNEAHHGAQLLTVL